MSPLQEPRSYLYAQLALRRAFSVVRRDLRRSQGWSSGFVIASSLFLLICSNFFFFFSLGFQEALDCFGAFRAAYDSLQSAVQELLKPLALAHDRVRQDFVRLQEIVTDPSVFFQNMIERDPELVLTYDLLSYYATLFNWDSSLNFRQVLEGSRSLSEWLSSSQTSLEKPRSQHSDEPVQPVASGSGTKSSPPPVASAGPQDGGEHEDDVDEADATSALMPSAPSEG